MADENGERTTRRPKRGLFELSGLTEEDRRQVRVELRKVKTELAAGKVTASEARVVNNEHAAKVCYTREAALDAENVEAIACHQGKNIEKLVKVQRFDALKLVQKLSSKCSRSSNGLFNWSDLGRECGVCFNTVPSGVSFLGGALSESVATRKVRKRAAPRQKVVHEDVKEARPESVETKDKCTSDKLSAMEKLCVRTKKTLALMSNEAIEDGNADGQPELDALELLHDPLSFTQTVENIFTYGFLVKKGEGGIGVNSDGKLIVKRIRPSAANDDKVNTQAVCSFTMADWRRMNAVHKEQCRVGHREGEGEEPACQVEHSGEEEPVCQVEHSEKEKPVCQGEDTCSEKEEPVCQEEHSEKEKPV